MGNHARALCVLLVLVACGGAGPANAEPDAEPPPPGQLVAEVLAQLPREPISVAGDLIVRRRHGIEVATLGFDMALDWGADPATARYTLRDAFGADLEQLTVTRAPGQPPHFSYSSGQPLAPAPVPDLQARIRETDVSWMDLTLDFLWWDARAVLGTEEIRGRPCYIVEVVAPAPVAAAAPAGARVPAARARLWIDQKLRMLLQAEAFDAAGEPVRRLWVKSIKKINDRWMIKDMEIESYPVEHRTKLQVHTLNDSPAP